MATASSEDSPRSHTYFEVENPFKTFAAFMIYTSIALFVILLLVLVYGWMSVNLMEITTFILISGITILPIIGLIFTDTALGPNSPVGLVVKHSVDERGKMSEGGQWVINVGGNQRNNFSDGLQVPIYVVVFGVAGGYLRYLYETVTTRADETKKEFEKITKHVKPEFYEKDWQFRDLSFHDKVSSAFNKLILRNKTKISESNTSVVENVDADVLALVFHVVYELKNGDTTKAQKYFRLLQKELQGNKNQKELQGNKKMEEKIFKLRRHEILKEKRKYYLFKCLHDIALLFLSPLLAIAVWFLLVQLGLKTDQAVNGQLGIFVIGTVSFTVGLVTNEVVQTLINFTKRTIGGQQNQQQAAGGQNTSV